MGFGVHGFGSGMPGFGRHPGVCGASKGDLHDEGLRGRRRRRRPGAGEEEQDQRTHTCNPLIVQVAPAPAVGFAAEMII